MAVNEQSALKIDWKLALLGLLVALGGVTAFFEGLPWPTRSEIALHDQLWDAKLSSALANQTINTANISAQNSQISAVTAQISSVATKEEDDRRDIEMLERQRENHSLKQELRREQYAAKWNKKSYENQFKAMENQARKQAVGL